MDSEVLQSDKSIQTEKRNTEKAETNEEKVKNFFLLKFFALIITSLQDLYIIKLKFINDLNFFKKNIFVHQNLFHNNNAKDFI